MGNNSNRNNLNLPTMGEDVSGEVFGSPNAFTSNEYNNIKRMLGLSNQLIDLAENYSKNSRIDFFEDFSSEELNRIDEQYKQYSLMIAETLYGFERTAENPNMNDFDMDDYLEVEEELKTKIDDIRLAIELELRDRG